MPARLNETAINPTTENSLTPVDAENFETTATVNDKKKSVHVVINSADFYESYNIPPTGNGVIIYMAQSKTYDYEYHIEPLKFGVLQVWAKPQDASGVGENGPEYSREVKQHQAKYFNCRKETLAQNQSVWSTARKHHRCVVPILGYFEWHSTKQGKIPHYIYSEKAPVLYLAGLYAHNTNYNETRLVGSAPYFSSFSIVTGPADGNGKNDLLWLHSRKPIFLEPNSAAWYEWLDPEQAWDTLLAEKCLDTTTNPVYDELVWHKVGKSVGNPNNKGPDVIKEDKVKQQSILLFFLPKKETPKGVKRENTELVKKEEKGGARKPEEASSKRIKKESS